MKKSSFLFAAHVLMPLLAAAVAGCGAPPEVTLAEKQVPEFHALLEQGRVAEIYAQASPQFRSAGPESDLLEFLSAVRRKLGPMLSTARQTWRVDLNTGGKFATLVYKTQFAQGEATEQFVYQVKNGTALLVGYNINSNALVVH